MMFALFSTAQGGCFASETSFAATDATPAAKPDVRAIASTIQSEPLPAPPSEKRPLIWLQPYGAVANDVLLAAQEGLQEVYGFEVELLPPLQLPESAYYKPRKRYRADHLLAYLDAMVERRCIGHCRILGITSQDISVSTPTRTDWGVFGYSLLPGAASIVSTHRLQKHHPTRTAFLHRVSIAAIHELGHALGLPHCVDYKNHCPMRAAEGKITITDDSNLALGPGCKARLERKFDLPRKKRSKIAQR